MGVKRTPATTTAVLIAVGNTIIVVVVVVVVVDSLAVLNHVDMMMVHHDVDLTAVNRPREIDR